MEPIRFSAPIIIWRGPAPHHFAALSQEAAGLVRAAAPLVSYGWGVVPVAARIGDVAFTTSLFPRDGGYLLPLKAAVRRRLGLAAGDVIAAELTLVLPLDR